MQFLLYCGPRLEIALKQGGAMGYQVGQFLAALGQPSTECVELARFQRNDGVLNFGHS